MSPPPELELGQQGAAVPPPPGVVVPTAPAERVRTRGRIRSALPLLGPANLRDTMALPLDRATALSSVATDSFGQAATLSMWETVHTRA